MNSSDVVLTCQICGLTATDLVSHIIRVHKMTVLDYKQTFNVLKVRIPTRAGIAKMRTTVSLKPKNVARKKMLNARRDEIEREFVTPLRCEICGHESMMSLISHITRRHKMTMDDYRNAFPGVVVQRRVRSDIERGAKSASIAMKKHWASDYDAVLSRQSGPNRVQYWLNKGFCEDEALQRVSAHQRDMSQRAQTPENKLLQSQRNVGNANPMSLKSIAKRCDVSLDEARQLTPCYGRCDELHPMFGKQHTLEALEKIANSTHLRNPSWRSKPEIEIAEFVSSICDNVLLNKKLGRWNVDILIPNKNLIIEHFGCMWHMCRRHHDMDALHPIFKITAGEVHQRDERKLNDLTVAGYRVLVVWECDWRADRVSCERMLQDAINLAQ